ncbi:unnamed protein product [Closterium sp. Naga37s-1]|nr:unnamed protein product [Closterium sp. Naga37s-1]
MGARGDLGIEVETEEVFGEEWEEGRGEEAEQEAEEEESWAASATLQAELRAVVGADGPCAIARQDSFRRQQQQRSRSPVSPAPTPRGATFACAAQTPRSAQEARMQLLQAQLELLETSKAVSALKCARHVVQMPGHSARYSSCAGTTGGGNGENSGTGSATGSGSGRSSNASSPRFGGVSGSAQADSPRSEGSFSFGEMMSPRAHDAQLAGELELEQQQQQQQQHRHHHHRQQQQQEGEREEEEEGRQGDYERDGAEEGEMDGEGEEVSTWEVQGRAPLLSIPVCKSEGGGYAARWWDGDGDAVGDWGGGEGMERRARVEGAWAKQDGGKARSGGLGRPGRLARLLHATATTTSSSSGGGGGGSSAGAWLRESLRRSASSFLGFKVH